MKYKKIMIKTIYDIPEHIFKTSYQNATIGHVLTPSKLALEMIETLPSDFIKGGIKIFDPACKNGSFLFQLVIKQLDNGWVIKDIENSLYTCDTLNASLNIAESGIKHIIRFPYQNSLIKINNLLYKHIEIELLYDKLIKTISKNKYISIRTFINNLLLDRKNNWLIVKFEENLIHFIKKYEGLSKTESKLFGEVFTPQALIEEMLDTLPADVWTNKNLKWLDPAVGIGNFPAAILNRLMEGLKDVIVDSDERRKHILEEMLYMGDISTKNLFLLYQLFDQNNEFKLNVFRGDFLSEKFDKQMVEWGLDGFDLVVGNPPYQASDNKSNKLWVKFTKKVFNLSKNICFIVPVSLMVSESNQITEIRNIMCKRSNIFNLTKTDIFNVSEKVVFFTSIDNLENNTIIIFNDGQKNIKSDSIIKRLPINIGDDLKISILKKIESYSLKNDYVYDFYHGSNQTTPERLKNKGLISYKQSDEFKYKVHHSASQTLYSKVLVSEYSKNNQTTYNKLKVVINYSGGFIGDKYMFLSKDMIGKQMVGIEVDNEEIGKNIINTYSRKLFEWYIKNEKSGGFNTGIFKLPKLDSSKSWADEELYQYFNLTPEEIQLIEETIQEPTKKKKSKKK